MFQSLHVVNSVIAACMWSIVWLRPVCGQWCDCGL